MYLEQIRIQRFKRIRDWTLNLSDADGNPRMWTVLIAPNGCGKTSVLQAIALTAAGRAEVNNLANEVREHVVDQRSREPMEVQARWRVGGQALQSGVSLHVDSYSYKADSTWVGPQDEVPDGDPLEDARAGLAAHNPSRWFAAAYGVHRFVSAGRPQAPKNPSIERLRTVFDPSATLQGPWFFDSVDPQRAREFAQISKIAFERVQFQLGQLAPATVGKVELKLQGAGGIQFATDLLKRKRFSQQLGKDSKAVTMPLAALAHGLQSILSLVLDILGHFAADPRLGWKERPEGQQKAKTDWANRVLNDLAGVVLIDELDLHLHPSWQVGIVSALRTTFPKLQFIVTTHSPVVLAQVAPHEIVRLDADPLTGDVAEVAIDPDTGELKSRLELGERAYLPDPRQMTAGELMQSLFGLHSAYPNPNGALIRQWLALVDTENESQLVDAGQQSWAQQRRQLKKELVQHKVNPDTLLRVP